MPLCDEQYTRPMSPLCQRGNNTGLNVVSLYFEMNELMLQHWVNLNVTPKKDKLTCAGNVGLYEESKDGPSSDFPVKQTDEIKY